MSFDHFNLNSNINRAINMCGYSSPTPIQSKSIPIILNGNDLCAIAQTGSGKTAAFILPILHRLTEIKRGNNPKVLIISPTRELASQIKATTIKYNKFLNLRITEIVGGSSYQSQKINLSRPNDIIIATPGRLLDHLRKNHINLKEIQILVLDEADRLLDMGFIEDIKLIANATPSNRQTLLFSATYDKKLDKIINQLLKNPQRIDLSAEKLTPHKIKQDLYFADNIQHKLKLLQHFIKEQNIYKAIIFTATKINADKLANNLREQNFSVAALHGDLKQHIRNRAIDKLRSGKIQFLVATDVAARGIDIADISHVINYDLPRFAESYVHRIGRTGRANREGLAITFVTPDETHILPKIERYISQQLSEKTVIGLEPTKKPNNLKKFTKGKHRKGTQNNYKKFKQKKINRIAAI